MVLVERKLSVLPETSWLWLATQFLAHDWFSLSHIYLFFLKIYQLLEHASPMIEPLMTRFRTTPDFIDFPYSRVANVVSAITENNRNTFQGMKDLFFLFFLLSRATCGIVISCRPDRRRVTVRRGKEGRYTQKTKDLPGHGIWKVSRAKRRNWHLSLGSFCKQAKNSWQDCSERLWSDVVEEVVYVQPEISLIKFPNAEKDEKRWRCYSKLYKFIEWNIPFSIFIRTNDFCKISHC